MKSYFHFKKLAVIILIVQLLFSIAHSGNRFQINLDGLFGLPQGDFKTNTLNDGYGIGFEFVYQPYFLPFNIGTSLKLVEYGSEKSHEMIYTSTANFDADVITKNQMVLWHIFLRAQKRYGVIRPYLETIMGLNYIYTNTELDFDGNAEETISSTNFDDTAFSYGAGAGVMVRVYEHLRKNHSGRTTNSAFSLLVNFQVRFLKGSRAEYLTEGAITRINDDLVYEVSESNTDLLLYQIGLTLEL